MSTDRSQRLSVRQRQTLHARQAFAARFTSPEAKSNHFRELARRANNGRVVLSSGKATALADAYATAEPEVRAVEELATVWSPLASILAEIAERVALSAHRPPCAEPNREISSFECTAEEQP